MERLAEEIFADALDLDPGARPEFLARACGNNDALRREVESLLADSCRADALFADLTQGAFGLPERQTLEKPGSLIGPYKLSQKLGEGGFGVVWRAQQETPISRQVALKVIKAGMDTGEVLARFEAERQALARMEHPNIARVLDAGATPAGRPYFVMELVRGRSITRFCDEERLEPRARLRLFVEVCAAINHAHQKGIIHRDIKPSNVLVSFDGKRPVVKVIDFGIAKAFEGRLTDLSLHTRIDQMIGTPAYMSPEQAGLGGQDVDTRSDIYSLGALLYELLTGLAPFDQQTLVLAGYEEMRRIVREVEPAKPSARLTSLSLQAKEPIMAARRISGTKFERLVSQELDWIAMKALEKSRERRYETADALARDVERFLSEEPVEARPPDPIYRLGKFARRHRRAILASGVFLLFLTVATTVSLWLAVRAKQAEQLAETRLAMAVEERNAKDNALQDAEAVSLLMTDFFQRPLPSMDGRTATVADALDLALRKLDKDLLIPPPRRALLKEKLADSYQSLGLHSAAIGLRQTVLQIRRDQLGDNGPRTISSLEALAENLYQSRRYDEALASANEAVWLSEARDSLNGELVVNARSRLADLEKRIAARKSLAPAAEAHPEPEPSPPPSASATPSDITVRHAAAKDALGELDKQVAALRESREDDLPEVIAAMSHLAKSYYNAGFRADSVRIQEEIVDILRRKSGEDSPETIMAMDDLAYYLDRAKRWKDSEELRTKVVEKQRAAFGAEDPRTLQTQTALALQLFLGGQFEKSLANCEDAVAVMRKTHGSSQRATLNAICTQARCYAALGRTSEAMELLTEAAPQMRDDTFVNLLLAQLQLWSGHSEEYSKTRRWMLDYAKEGAARMRTRADILDRAVLICSLAPLDNAGQGKEMLSILEQARKIDSAPGAPPLQQRNSEWILVTTGMASFRAGDLTRAELLFRQALVAMNEDGEKSFRRDRRWLAELYLAMTLHQQRKTEEAKEFFLSAKKHIAPLPSKEHPLLDNSEASGSPMHAWLAFNEAKAFLGLD